MTVPLHNLENDILFLQPANLALMFGSSPQHINPFHEFLCQVDVYTSWLMLELHHLRAIR